MTVEAFLHPHSFCLGNSPELIWNFVVSDLVISVAYILLSAALMFMVHNRQMPYKAFFRAFAAFIFLCACTHAAHIYTMFYAEGFHFAALVNDVTAAVSCAVAISVLAKLADIVSFLRDRAHDVCVRGERYQDREQILMMGSALQDLTFQRAERMLNDRRSEL